MIKEFFLPEFFNNKRVYAQTILSFYLEDKSVTCIKISSDNKYSKLEKVIKSEKILSDENFSNSNKNNQSSVVKHIKKIVSEMGEFDQAYIAIPSKLSILKEIKLPFLDIDKIRMVLDYEIESKLPFSIKEAVLDFIIINQDKENKTTKLLVSATRIKDIEAILEIYQKAGIDPTKITLDLFSIFNVYNEIPEYKNIEVSTAIIDIGQSSTRIALIENNTIKITRVIPKGIDNIVNAINIDTKINHDEIKKNINNFGLSPNVNEKYDKALQKHAIDFFNEIQFTLNSFSLKLNLNKAIGKILFTGNYSNLKNLTVFCKNLLQITSEKFNVKKIFSNEKFINKINNSDIDWNKYIVPLGSAIISEKLLNFNLRRKSLAKNKTNFITKQLIMAIGLLIIIFVSIFTIGSIQTYKLSSKIKEIERIETKKLLKILPKNTRIPKKISFLGLINKANRSINEKLEMWGPFENEQLKPLYILEELTKIMDKQKFNILTESISISEENEIAKIEIEGIFSSKTGSDNFKYFEELEKRFENSTVFELWENEEIESRQEEDKGVRFSVKLKLKEPNL